MEHAEYDTGNVTEDLKTQSLTRQLLYNPKLQAACPIPFDEAKLWKGQSGPELTLKIQKQFRNIRYFWKPTFASLESRNFYKLFGLISSNILVLFSKLILSFGLGSLSY